MVQVTSEANIELYRNYPLAVDLDGTLFACDTLVESFIACLFTRPLVALEQLFKLPAGRAAFKRSMSIASPISANLPRREAFIEWLKNEHSRGRAIHLVSAADQFIVDAVALQFSFLASATGSNSATNLKGANKLNWLKLRFPDGFSYAGDAKADLLVWTGSTSIILVGATNAVARRARALGLPVEHEFDIGSPSIKTWLKALRVHQWAKNLLLFIPLILSPLITSFETLVICLVGFVLLGVAASATYLINDLSDLNSDRLHRTKRNRPLASGKLPIRYALAAIGVLLPASLVLSFLISPPFCMLVVLYLITTLSYSFKFKRLALFDAIVLAFLYTLRLFMGMAIAGLQSSVWLLVFSAFFFFAMSLAKRHVEVAAATGPADQLIAGRGYRPSDAPLTLAFGIASTVASILVMIQYLMVDAFPSNFYSFPAALWMAPLLIGVWVCRIWLLAQRGELDDDPVAFATKDKVSLCLGAVLAASVIVARFL